MAPGKINIFINSMYKHNMTIINTKIMQLENALSSYKDTKGQVVSFKVDPKNSDLYTGKGSDGFDYYIEIKKPIMCEVKQLSK